jgi:hypothetical protein
LPADALAKPSRRVLPEKIRRRREWQGDKKNDEIPEDGRQNDEQHGHPRENGSEPDDEG